MCWEWEFRIKTCLLSTRPCKCEMRMAPKAKTKKPPFFGRKNPPFTKGKKAENPPSSDPQGMFKGMLVYLVGTGVQARRLEVLSNTHQSFLYTNLFLLYCPCLSLVDSFVGLLSFVWFLLWMPIWKKPHMIIVVLRSFHGTGSFPLLQESNRRPNRLIGWFGSTGFDRIRLINPE